MKPSPESTSTASQEGTILLLTLTVLVGLFVLGGAFLSTAFRDHGEHKTQTQAKQAMYIAEAGISEALVSLRAGTSIQAISNAEAVSFGGGTYSVVGVEDSGVFQITVTAEYRGTKCAIACEVGTLGMSKGRTLAGLLGNNETLIGESNLIDSYDSSQGLYIDQANQSFGGEFFANNNGGIQSNGLMIVGPSAMVFGSAIPGPSNTAQVLGYVDGSTAPATSTEPFPPITIPNVTDMTATDLKYGGNTSTTLDAGLYHFDKLDLDQNALLIIKGPANIVAKDLSLKKDARIEIDQTDGPVHFYVTKNFKVQTNKGGGIWSLRRKPSDIRFFILSDNYAGFESTIEGNPDTKIDLKKSSELHGVVYVPNGKLKMKDDSELFGAASARELDMGGRARFHYDESLANLPANLEGQPAAPWGPENDPSGGSNVSTTTKSRTTYDPSALVLLSWHRASIEQ